MDLGLILLHGVTRHSGLDGTVIFRESGWFRGSLDSLERSVGFESRSSSTSLGLVTRLVILLLLARRFGFDEARNVERFIGRSCQVHLVL